MSCFKCKMCGGNLNITGEEKVVECEYCGSKQTIPNADNEKKVNLFNRANRLRIASEFDKAAGIYETILSEFPEEAEAYWGLCLCNYGIEYVDDPATARKIPTCHRASFEKMRKDENYEMALENADLSARVVYEEQAKEIDRIMSEILAVSREERPYDIFICYKETDHSGSRTPDSVLAQDIYDALTLKGYYVFFSRITLEDKLGTQYEPYIFSALNSARMMLVVGTDYEYFNAVWVKNEWSRFIKLMARDKTKVLIPCYKDMDPYDMPDEFKGLQSQDCGKLGFLQDLTRGIDKLFGRTEFSKDATNTSSASAQQMFSANLATASTDSLLKRVYIFLEDENWEEANSYCEKVLDINPECAEAYLGKLMAEMKVRKTEDLADCAEPFDSKDNFSKIVRFGNEKLITEMKNCISHINERIENARREKAERINQTVEAVKVAFEKKINEKENIPLKEKRTELQKHLSELSALAAIFDEKKNKLDADEAEGKAIIGEISKLQNKRSSLGILAVREKREIDQKINELQETGKKLEVQLQKLKTELRGYMSKASVDAQICTFQSQLETVEKQLEASELLPRSELSFSQAMEALKDIKVKAKFIKNHAEVYSAMFDRIEFGTYMQEEEGKNKTPISWRVLAREGNAMLLFSEKALDCGPFSDSETNLTWENCSLRKWLNDTFLKNAFNTEEQELIQNTTVLASENPYYSVNPGNATTDKIFLMSIQEIEKYFSSDDERKCWPTAYATAQRMPANNSYGKGDAVACWWWLRSPGSDPCSTAYVRSAGSVNYDGSNAKVAHVCVRPALWINLDA